MGSREVKRAPGAALGTKVRVLSFCRPYLISDFRSNLAPVADEYEIDYLTDGHAPGTRDTRARPPAETRTGD